MNGGRIRKVPTSSSILNPSEISDLCTRPLQGHAPCMQVHEKLNPKLQQGVLPEIGNLVCFFFFSEGAAPGRVNGR